MGPGDTSTVYTAVHLIPLSHPHPEWRARPRCRTAPRLRAARAVSPPLIAEPTSGPIGHSPEVVSRAWFKDYERKFARKRQRNASCISERGEDAGDLTMFYTEGERMHRLLTSCSLLLLGAGQREEGSATALQKYE